MKNFKTGRKLLAGATVATALIFAMSGGTLLAQNAPFSVNADTIEYDMNSGAGKATGTVVLQQDGGKISARGGGVFNSKNKTAHLYGGVTGVKGDQRIESRELVMHNENFVSAIGDARITKGDKTLAAPQVDYHEDTQTARTSGGSARLSATDGSWITAGTISYDARTGLVEADGGVKLASPPRNLTGSGDRAIYETKDGGTVELIGNAIATQNGNTVSGQRLRLNNAGGTTSAQGNVKLVYFPKEKALDGRAFGQGAKMVANNDGHRAGGKTVIDRAREDGAKVEVDRA